MSYADTTILRLERTFAARPEAVFDAWTNPEVLRRWWAGQPTGTCPGCDVDLRVGGAYRLQMRNAEGEEHVVGGEYREVDPPRRLRYTWCWEGEDGPDPGHVSLVTVDFHADGDATRVVLEHSDLPSQESRERHEAGWCGALDNLERRTFPGPG